METPLKEMKLTRCYNRCTLTPLFLIPRFVHRRDAEAKTMDASIRACLNAELLVLVDYQTIAQSLHRVLQTSSSIRERG
jgi:hypothetical protein